MTEKVDPEHGHRAGDISVTIAAPNNDQRPFVVNDQERADRVARDAVTAFVAAQQMTQMDCSLALVVDGVATLLDDASRLEEDGVHDGARLALVPKKPKTDG